jgi:hypothetical protein
MKSVTNRYRPNFRQARASPPVFMKTPTRSESFSPKASMNIPLPAVPDQRNSKGRPKK